jgi:acyl transferase domain-containing protein
VDAREFAIIGIGCRFPGDARNSNDFWNLLVDNYDCIEDNHRPWWNTIAECEMNKMYTGFMSNVDKFDPLFWKLSPKEAKVMDPMQRIILEITWEALEDANIVPDSLMGSQTGVYIGVHASEYGELLSQSNVRHLMFVFVGGNTHSMPRFTF